MNLFDNKRLGLALIISLVAVACAAPTIPNETGNDGEDEESSESNISGDKKKKAPSKTPTKQAESAPEGETPPPADNAPPGNPAPNTPAPTGGGQCAQEQSGEACFQCCDAASNGELAKADEAFGSCACEGQCATACGTNFCNGAEPSAACETCLTGKCEPAADAACGSAACKAGVACLQASGCDQKQ